LRPVGQAAPVRGDPGRRPFRSDSANRDLQPARNFFTEADIKGKWRRRRNRKTIAEKENSRKIIYICHKNGKIQIGC